MSKTTSEYLYHELTCLRDYLCSACNLYKEKIANLHPNYWQSAHNLIAYMALRQRDLRELQTLLSEQGLSSFGWCEAHVLASIEAVLRVLSELSDSDYRFAEQSRKSPDFAEGAKLLDDHALRLFGARNREQYSHIMVTMPSEAANDYDLVERLLLNGMDCMRINCAHDNSDAWLAMIKHLRQAQQLHRLPCKISMDLGGPKLRTAAISPFDQLIKVKPQRNAHGALLAPARILLTASPRPLVQATAFDLSIVLRREHLALLSVNDRLSFRDTRAAKRHLEITDSCADGYIATLNKTAYMHRSTRYDIVRGKHRIATLCSERILRNDPYLILQRGDTLTICRNPDPDKPGEIACTIPEILEQLKPGEPIWFDDGKIGGEVKDTAAGRVDVAISYAAGSGSKLRADKGINLPHSHLQLPALTAKDLQDLEFVAEHADIVALSFANTVSDVRTLCQSLRKLGRDSVAVILKIETALGFQNLVPMLLEAMTRESCGVMIARGDLAIEAGFERLAEVQEEILWICEAAHVPVVWATQVLDNLAKHGAPTRAEISDAAMGHRADCVMLNKGEHISEALVCLRDILQRMETHEYKKHARLRSLSVANSVLPALD